MTRSREEGTRRAEPKLGREVGRRDERARPTTAGLRGGALEVGNEGERSRQRGYSRPKSSDVEPSAYRSSRGRGAHQGRGEAERARSLKPATAEARAAPLSRALRGERKV